MRRFMLRIIIGVLTFIIGLTTAMLIGKVNPFHHSRSRCAERSWNPTPPPTAQVNPAAPHACAMKSVIDATGINAPVAPDEPPPPPPPPPTMNKTGGGNAQPRAR